MAENDQDLVSQIQVTGGDEATAEVEKFAEGSSDAFAKVGDAAEKASDRVNKSSDKINKSYKKVTDGAKQVGNSGQDLERAGLPLAKLEKLTANFTASIPKAVKASADFAKRLAVLGAAAVAAGVGVVAAAKRVAEAVDGQSNALDKQAAAQIDANNAALNAETAQINYESSVRQLNKQLATGQITYQQYAEKVRELNDSFKEQQRVANEVAAAQARVKEENDRVTKALADRKAYTQLIDTLGGPLVTALSALGRATEQIRKDIVNTFGPSASAIIDVITGVLQTNSNAISTFFGNAGKKIQDLLTKNGPAIQKLLENIGKAAASVFNGLIDAAPALLDFFNNKAVPAVESFVNALDSVAKFINKFTGSKLTAGFIILVGILGSVTGAFKALFSVGGLVLRLLGVIAGVISAAFGISFGAAIAVVAALAVGLYLLATQVDWSKWADKAVTAWETFKKSVSDTVASSQAKWQSFVSFFSGIWTSITGFFTAAWATITSGASAAAQFVQDAWNATVTWFSTALTSIGTFFVNLWTSVTAGVSAAILFVQTSWQALVTWFQTTIITPIQTYFATLWTNIQTAVTTAIDGLKAAWNAVVQFFTDIANSIKTAFTDAMDVIVSAWNTGINKLKSFFSDLYSAALAKVQPIIDLFKRVVAAAKEANTAANSTGDAGATARNGGQFARGGKVYGGGTTTSDSIPAWLSRGEFVVRAKAVQKYGSDFMHAVNQGRLPPMGFAGGGMPSSSPVAAHRTNVGTERRSSMTPLNLSLFGQEFPGLMMPEDVGRKLTKFAIQKQTVSAGRKPSWVGGGRT